MLCLLQQGADIISILPQVSKLTNLRLLRHLPLDNESLWSLVSFSRNSTSHFPATAHFGCLPFAVNISSGYTHCKILPGIIAPVILQVSTSVSKNLHCDVTSPIVTLGTGSYSDFNLTEAVFLQSAFWALPFFSTTTVRDGTVWSYAVQWLLWQTGQGLTIYLPPSYQKHASTLLPSSSCHEVINLLSQSNCSSSVHKCINLLLKRLLSKHLISQEFAKSTANWLKDLKKVGYTFPTAKQQKALNCSIPVTWSPTLASDASTKRFAAVANVKQSAELQKQLCEKRDRVKTNWTDFGVIVNLTHPWNQFRHLLLVITFNKPHYEVIPYVELLYRSIFPHILYCLPTPLDTASIPVLRGYQISYITYAEWPVHRTPGSVNYQCAIQAVRMNFLVDGFLFASDDLLLLPVPLSKLKPDRVWFVPTNEIRIGDLDTLRECHLGMCDFHPHWDWWAAFKSATVEALDRMSQLARVSPLFYHCLTQLRQRNGIGRSQIRVNGAYSDIFHIPSQIAHDFATVAKVFADLGVFLEIAVPTVLRCIEPPENFQSLPGKDIQVCLLPDFFLDLCTFTAIQEYVLLFCKGSAVKFCHYLCDVG